jgi:hypothetical protein
MWLLNPRQAVSKHQNSIKRNIVDKENNSFDNWLNDLEDQDQPTCNIDNPEDCEACGS